MAKSEDVEVAGRVDFDVTANEGAKDLVGSLGAENGGQSNAVDIEGLDPAVEGVKNVYGPVGIDADAGGDVEDGAGLAAQAARLPPESIADENGGVGSAGDIDQAVGVSGHAADGERTRDGGDIQRQRERAGKESGGVEALHPAGEEIESVDIAGTVDGDVLQGGEFAVQRAPSTPAGEEIAIAGKSLDRAGDEVADEHVAGGVGSDPNGTDKLAGTAARGTPFEFEPVGGGRGGNAGRQREKAEAGSQEGPGEGREDAVQVDCSVFLATADGSSLRFGVAEAID